MIGILCSFALRPVDAHLSRTEKALRVASLGKRRSLAAEIQWNGRSHNNVARKTLTLANGQTGRREPGAETGMVASELYQMPIV
jgi:hypothetical protein